MDSFTRTPKHPIFSWPRSRSISRQAMLTALFAYDGRPLPRWSWQLPAWFALFNATTDAAGDHLTLEWLDTHRLYRARIYGTEKHRVLGRLHEVHATAGVRP
jgi:hypothetical protein